jgi:uncharacterized repeat protein (TIGR01451 family)
MYRQSTIWRAFVSGMLALASALSSTPVAAMSMPLAGRAAALAQPVLPLARTQSIDQVLPLTEQSIPQSSTSKAALQASAALSNTCTTRLVTNSYTSGQPFISTNGNRVAFWSTGSFDVTKGNSDGNLEVFLYDSAALNYTQVTSSTGSILGGFNLWPTLNASGTLMTFASDRDLTGGNSDGNFEIFVADVSGTGTPTLTQITTSTIGVNTAPHISADGKSVVFVSNRDLVGANSDLSTEIFIATLTDTQLLSYTQVTSGSTEIVNDEPVNSADGTKIAYVARGTTTSTLYLADITGATLTPIGTSSILVDVHPSISADGSRVVFVSDEDLVAGQNANHTQQAFLYDTTSSLSQITSAGNVSNRCSPSISANGLRVACVSDDANIYLYSAATGNKGQLTTGGSSTDPMINGDGQAIAYTENGLVYASVCPVADMEIAKSSSAETALAGDMLNYTLVVSNNGPGVANNVIVSDALPAGVALYRGMISDQQDQYLGSNDFVAANMAGATYISPVMQLAPITNVWELPDNSSVTGWQPMMSTTLLLHLNGPAGQFNDTSGNSLNASCSGGCLAALQAGRLISGVVLNGSSQVLSVANDARINPDIHDDFTVMAWINPGSAQVSTSPADNSIIEKWDGNGGYPFVIRIYNQSAGASAGIIVAARYDNVGTNPAVQSSKHVNDDRWHHVAFVKRGSMLYLFIDGVLESSTQDTTGESFWCSYFSICTTINASPLYLGSRGGNQNRYSGGLDEVAIFNRGLADSEIQNVYSHQSAHLRFAGYYTSRLMDAGRSVSWNSLAWQPTTPNQIQLPDNNASETSYVSGNVNMTGTAALYHFNETTSSGFKDSSINGISNTASIVTYGPGVSQTGVFSTAIYMSSGSYQSLVVNDNPAWHWPISGTNEIPSLSIESWVKLTNAAIDQKIIGKSNISSGWVMGVINNQLYPEFWLYPSGTHESFQAGTIPNNEWTHLVVTFQKGGYYRLYVNGKQVYAKAVANGILDTTNPLRIGASPWSYTSYRMTGFLDETAVYNRELSANEVYQHYSRGVTRQLFQVRTCASTCSSESFVGPNGAGSYYSIQPSQAVTPVITLNVAQNRYFQYQTAFESDDPGALPGVISVTVGPAHGAAVATQGTCNLDNPVVCNVGSLDAGRVATVTVSTELTSSVNAGSLVNTAHTESDADDINPANNVATATTNIERNVTLSVAKLVTPTSATVVGQQVTYTLLITNNGSSPANSVTLSDTLPQQFIPQPAQADQFLCTINGGLMTCNASAIAANTTAIITVSGRAFPNPIGVLTNTVFVAASEFPTGTSAVVTLPVPVQTDLGVRQTAPASVDAGSSLVSTVTVTNSTMSSAPNVVLTDTLDSRVSFVDATPSANCVGVAGPVICALGNMFPGESRTVVLSMTVSPSATGSVTNTVNVGSSGVDSYPANNTVSTVTNLTTHADLRVVKSALADVDAGATFVYTLTVANDGPSDAHNVYITDTLPAGVRVITQSSPLSFGLVATNTTGARYWYTGTLPAQANGQIRLPVTVTNSDAPASVVNRLDITSGTAEVDNANNTSVYTTTVHPVAPGSVSVPQSYPCALNQPCVLTATVGPANVTLPITYTWTATDQVTQTMKVYSTTSVVTFTFTTGGVKTLGVVATNSGGSVPGSGSVNVPAADLDVTIDGPASVSAGSVIQYTLTFTNTGPTDAHYVTLTSQLPPAVTFGGVVGSLPGTFVQAGLGASNVVTWTAATLAGDSTPQTIVFTGTVTNTSIQASITNTVHITSTTTDPAPVNNSDSVSTTVTPVTLSGVTLSPPALCSSNNGGSSTNPCLVSTFISPTNATLPITYTWQATGANNVPSPSTSSSTQIYFNTVGTQTITVTASAYSVSVTDVVTVSVGP